MYKLLIVEDEVWEREGLANFISWSAYNIDVVGTATNGQQGLQMAKKYLPDIIITDIRMPIMDGLELSREVKVFLPKCKIIVITGHNDFQYAKDAIHIGVSDFLLKPVRKEELLKTINKAKTGLHIENRQEEYLSELKFKLTECEYKERERFLLNILNSTCKYGEDLLDSERRMFSSCSQNAVAVVIRFDGFVDYQETGYNKAPDHFKDFYKKVREVVGNRGLTAERYMEKREIVICLPLRNEGRNEVNTLIHRIQQHKGDIKNSDYIIGVGSLSNTVSDFVKSYNQAQTVLNRIFFLRDTNIFYYDDLLSGDEDIEASVCNFLHSAPDYSKRILKAVISLDGNEVIALTGEFFNFIYNNPVDKGLVCSYLAGIISELSVLLFSNGITLDNEYNVEGDIIERFNNCIKLERVQGYIKKVLIYANGFFIKKRKNKEEFIIDDVMNIINTDYSENIGLEVIAQRLGISPNYLGILFKKYVGKRFTEVLTSVRMKKAEELLLSGEDNIMDIAKAVGYDNISYFCTVFKKTHGISPMEYREKNAYESRKN